MLEEAAEAHLPRVIRRRGGQPTRDAERPQPPGRPLRVDAGDDVELERLQAVVGSLVTRGQRADGGLAQELAERLLVRDLHRLRTRDGLLRRTEQQDRERAGREDRAHTTLIGAFPRPASARTSDFQIVAARPCRARRYCSQATRSTWIVPATGIAASAPSTPASSAPISTETRITSGDSRTVRL